MSSESSTAFYKGVKFWLVLLLAAGLAALLWRMWRQEEVAVTPSVGSVLSAPRSLGLTARANAGRGVARFTSSPAPAACARARSPS